MLLAVNYHYIEVNGSDFAGVHSLSVNDFNRHISFLSENFRIIGIDDLLRIPGKTILSDNFCLLTFDDGLKCHYQVAYRMLQKRGVPGVFFIGSEPLQKGRASITHKLHYLKAKCDNAFLAKHITDTAKRSGYPVDNIDQKEIKDHYRYDTHEAALVKYLCNYVLPQEILTVAIEQLFCDFIGNEKNFCSNWYADKEEIKKMAENGMSVESHCASHSALALLTSENILNELENSRRFLMNLIEKNVEAVSYPLGNAKAVDTEVGKLAQKVGYKLGFTMERAVNFSMASPLLLARVDCNDLPVGKNPLFHLKGNSAFRLNNNNKFCRRVYCDEQAT